MSDLFDYTIWPGPYSEEVPDEVAGARLRIPRSAVPDARPAPVTMPGVPVLRGRLGETPDKPITLRPTSVTAGSIGLRNGFSIAGVIVEARVPNRTLPPIYVNDYIRIPVESGLGGLPADQVYTVVEYTLSSDSSGFTDYAITIRPYVEGSIPA